MDSSIINNNVYYFSEISLLITHYNRSDSLIRLLISLKELNCVFGEIIVSDDGSEKKHLDKLFNTSEFYGTKLVLADRNRGLGNNINKGQDAVKNTYTLYIQEDFVPTVHFPENLKLAYNTMIHHENIDIVRFYAYITYPYLKLFEKGFYMMYLPFFGLNYSKIYQYSDHPHLRRSIFLSKFGRYQEGLEGDKTEYKMCVSFLKNKGIGLFFGDYKSLFTQENSKLEPSTMKRGWLRKSDNTFVSILRTIYLQLKNNYHIHLTKRR